MKLHRNIITHVLGWLKTLKKSKQVVPKWTEAESMIQFGHGYKIFPTLGEKQCGETLAMVELLYDQVSLLLGLKSKCLKSVFEKLSFWLQCYLQEYRQESSLTAHLCFGGGKGDIHIVSSKKERSMPCVTAWMHLNNSERNQSENNKQIWFLWKSDQENQRQDMFCRFPILPWRTGFLLRRNEAPVTWLRWWEMCAAWWLQITIVCGEMKIWLEDWCMQFLWNTKPRMKAQSQGVRREF